jgi:hypothetical protein
VNFLYLARLLNALFLPIHFNIISLKFGRYPRNAPAYCVFVYACMYAYIHAYMNVKRMVSFSVGLGLEMREAVMTVVYHQVCSTSQSSSWGSNSSRGVPGNLWNNSGLREGGRFNK